MSVIIKSMYGIVEVSGRDKRFSVCAVTEGGGEGGRFCYYVAWAVITFYCYIITTNQLMQLAVLQPTLRFG